MKFNETKLNHCNWWKNSDKMKSYLPKNQKVRATMIKGHVSSLTLVHDAASERVKFPSCETPTFCRSNSGRSNRWAWCSWSKLLWLWLCSSSRSGAGEGLGYKGEDDEDAAAALEDVEGELRSGSAILEAQKGDNMIND